jgi:hypothetical protein
MTDTPAVSPAASAAAPAAAPPAQAPTNSPFSVPVPERVERAAENFRPVAPSTPSDADWQKMSDTDRMAYARAAQASKAAAPAEAAIPPTSPVPQMDRADIHLIEPAAKGDQGEAKVKVGELELSETRLRDLATRAAADDARLATLPNADAYRVELPQDFKQPPGVEFKFDKQDPLIPQLKQWAFNRGLDQTTFSEGLSLYAATKVREQQLLAQARNVEVAKLGANATARVDAVMDWLKAMAGNDLGNALAGNLWTAKQVEAFERIMSKSISGGAATFNTSHRDIPEAGGISDAAWSRMSYAERVDYARSHPQPPMNGRGR